MRQDLYGGAGMSGLSGMSRSALAQSTLDALCAVAAARGALCALADPDRQSRQSRQGRSEHAPAAAAALGIVENELCNAAAALNTLARVLRLQVWLGTSCEEPSAEEGHMAKCRSYHCGRTAQHKCGKCGMALCWEHYVPAPEQGGALCLPCAFTTPGLLAGITERIRKAARPAQGDPETEPAAEAQTRTERSAE